MTGLPDVFLRLPIAHRGLHAPGPERPENSLNAIRSAVAAGYGVEIDLQLSADGEAVVFHDATLARLTGAPGAVIDCPLAELRALRLAGGEEHIPALAEVLDTVAGRTPVLVEIKTQPAAVGAGALEAAAARVLADYRGPVAVMSFNPASMAVMARIAPEIPRGLVTWSWPDDSAPQDAEMRARLRAIADFDTVGAVFISHAADDLERPRVAELAARGVPVLCWTIRSPAAEAAARRIAGNITFEDYLPVTPAP